MSNNNVKDWGEFQKLAELPCLEVLLFVGMLKNPAVLLLGIQFIIPPTLYQQCHIICNPTLVCL